MNSEETKPKKDKAKWRNKPKKKGGGQRKKPGRDRRLSDRQREQRYKKHLLRVQQNNHLKALSSRVEKRLERLTEEEGIFDIPSEEDLYKTITEF